MVEYFQIEDVPGKQFFRCERYAATMSAEACAGSWKQANQAGCEKHFKCKACPIGAVHAGETAASMSPLKGASICARCHTPSPRLIRGMHCVSCYNRQREWVIGRNAKGTKPVKLLPLHPRALRYFSGDEPVLIQSPYTADTDELIVSALRDSKNRVRFAFRGHMPGTPNQLRLF